MKKIIIFLIYLSLMTFIVSAYTIQEDISFGYYNLTLVNYNINGTDINATFEPFYQYCDGRFDKYIISPETMFSTKANCTKQDYYNYIDGEMSNKVEIPPSETITESDVFVGHEYLYASEAYDPDISVSEMRNILYGIQVNQDLTWDYDTFPDVMKKDGKLRTGVFQAFLWKCIELMDTWIQEANQRIANNEARLDSIETDLCNAGYVKYCN